MIETAVQQDVNHQGVQQLEPVLSAVGVTKEYGAGESAVSAVRGVDLDLMAGQITVLMGPSGSGKSTLMHLLAGLERPTSGEVMFEGRALGDFADDELASWRARHAGFVLQRNNLVPTLTVEENVAAPLMLTGMPRGRALGRARLRLAELGLDRRGRHWPSAVSGGEAARTAVARAVVGTPRVVFADEPTGALDSASSAVVIELLVEQVRASGAAALVVTHDPTVAEAGDRVVRIVDGRIEDHL